MCRMITGYPPTMLAVLLAAPLLAGELPARPYSYHEGFEGQNPVQFLSGRGDYVINYQGITDEDAYSGKKSYKLDVTFFNSSNTVTFYIPLGNVPIRETLKFTGRIKVKEAMPRSRAILALDLAFWPCAMEGISGARNFPWNPKCDRWVEIYADLPDRAHARAAQRVFLDRYWGVVPENVTPYAQQISLHVFARDRLEDPKGPRRVVVYVDDLRIEGEIPGETALQKDAEQRWAPVTTRAKQKIAEWKRIVAKAESELAALTNLSAEAEALKAEVTTALQQNDVRKRRCIQSVNKNGWMSGEAYRTLEPFYRNLKKHYLANIEALSRRDVTQRIHDRKSVVYAVSTTITPADYVLPDTTLIPGSVTDELSMTACPGEYESASFVLRAFVDIEGLRAEAGELAGKNGKIRADAVDIKVLKCWYQDDNARARRVFVPELLLNDESLIQVDHNRKRSRIRFNTKEGAKYLAYGDPGWLDRADRRSQTPLWVADDSDTLLPVNVAANENKQFWVTLHVPGDAHAGEYSGKIRLTDGAESLGEVTLRLEVLPVKLMAPYYRTSIYSHYQDTIETRYKNEMKNQVAHGINFPVSHLSYYGLDFLEQTRKTLQIRNEVGMPVRSLFGHSSIVYKHLIGRSHKGLTEIEITAKQKKRFMEEYAKYCDVAKSCGVKEIYFHLADERDAAELVPWLKVFDLVHEAGAKVITCGTIGRTFEIAGGHNDIYFCENGVSRREAAKWHSKRCKVWSIWNPNGGVEDSDVSRRNHGLIVWRNHYDGVIEWIYSMEEGWAEAASEQSGRGGDGVFNMVYRTTNKVIDTLQWEGYREGIDDVRYLTTLETAIRQAQQSKDAGRKAVAAAAEKYLEKMDVAYGDLDVIRARIIDYLLELR